MSFNPLKEKGISPDKQFRSWHEIAHRHFDKNEVDCYSRTRQILMNGIEVEAWNFKHNMARNVHDEETKRFLAMTRKIEDMQQTTVNWLTPSDQSVLETTLGYEQVAVDLTAWLSQNEPDSYVKETFDFGLLEDFDHLYRYSQWAYMEHGISPNKVLQGQTDVIFGRPTQNHHNCNMMRLRKSYDKETASVQTKVNILILVSAEQQTHNYYAENGMKYGNECLRETYAEIKDVEEEHVTMYESLIDPTESWYEKLLLHEFTEVCTYYNCMEDEENDMLKSIWEMFVDYEIGHLRVAAELFKRHENREPEEIIGSEIIYPCRFMSQKNYVAKVLKQEIDKRLGTNKDYTTIEKLPDDWASYFIQNAVGEDGSPTEATIRTITVQKGRDLVMASPSLENNIVELYSKGLQPEAQASNTVTAQEYEEMIEEEFEL